MKKINLPAILTVGFFLIALPANATTRQQYYQNCLKPANSTEPQNPTCYDKYICCKASCGTFTSTTSADGTTTCQCIASATESLESCKQNPSTRDQLWDADIKKMEMIEAQPVQMEPAPDTETPSELRRRPTLQK